MSVTHHPALYALDLLLAGEDVAIGDVTFAMDGDKIGLVCNLVPSLDLFSEGRRYVATGDIALADFVARCAQIPLKERIALRLRCAELERQASDERAHIEDELLGHTAA